MVQGSPRTLHGMGLTPYLTRCRALPHILHGMGFALHLTVVDSLIRTNTNALNEMLKPVQHDKKVCHSEPGPELDSGSMDFGILDLAMTINQLRLY